MSFKFNDTVKCGYVKHKKSGLMGWQKKYLIFRRASSKGPCRLERYSDERHATSSESCKYTDLTSVLSITRVSKKHAFSVNFIDGTSTQFALETDDETEEWLQSLLTECSPMDNPSNNVFADDRIPVCLLKSPLLAFSGECLLSVTAEHIKLYETGNHQQEIQYWPLNSIRHYGQDKGVFKFTSGRSSPTGEGLFVLNTVNHEKIYQAFVSATRLIAEAYKLEKHRMNHNGGAPGVPERETPKSGSTSSRTSSTSSSLSNGPHTPSHHVLKHSSSLPEKRPLPSTPDQKHHTPAHITKSFPVGASNGAFTSRRGDLPPIPSELPPTQSDSGYLDPIATPTGLTHSPLRSTRQASVHDIFDLPTEIAPLPTESQVEHVLSTMQQSSDSDDSDTYLYEESGLEPTFREFLKVRKDDD